MISFAIFLEVFKSLQREGITLKNIQNFFRKGSRKIEDVTQRSNKLLPKILVTSQKLL